MAASKQDHEENIVIEASEAISEVSTAASTIDSDSKQSSKRAEAFQVDFGQPMPDKNLQDAFKKFQQQRQVGFLKWK